MLAELKSKHTKFSNFFRRPFRTADRDTKKGFTIIEVLIVLAIASLILLIVFLAVSALQRNARNNQRHSDAAIILSAINECRALGFSKAQCAVPSNLPLDTSKLSIYTGVHYGSTGFNVHTTVSQRPPTLDEPNYLWGLQCNENGSIGASNANITFVVTYILEQSGNSYKHRCIDGG